MKKLFHTADTNDDGMLSFKEVKKLLDDMNIQTDARSVKIIYNVNTS